MPEVEALERGTQLLGSAALVVIMAVRMDLQSRGTADTLSRAKGRDRPRTVYGPDGVLLGEETLNARIYEVLG